MTRGRAVLVAAAAAAAVALAGVSAVRASDHLDGPGATADPQSDITDVFAFTSPENPAHVVLAMAVTPYAGDASTFSPTVDYAFRVQRVEVLQPFTLDTTARDVVCRFDSGSPQNVTCTAPGGLMATTQVGDPTGGGDAQSPMRVFAGMRSDPAFFDRQGALATLRTGAASFTGTNAFAGANVLAIVVELESRVFATVGDAGADGAPTLAVAAETVRGSH
ncbi:MAG TPA: DUF4331 family protein [Polyangiaceae bacterium]